MSVLAARDVDVSYGNVHALRGASVEVAPGESVALRGRSGSGKTTLLHVLAALVRPASGEVERNGSTSLVFQGANLLPEFSVLENVRFVSSPDADPEELLGLVGLAPKLDHLPSELSGGEAQRVAIARALAQKPEALLCDEPTGHLDTDTSARVLDLIAALRERFGFALVIATHDANVAARCERAVELRDGRVES